MTGQDVGDAMDEAVVRERRHLMSLCFRMLGTIAEAEDAVQETYSRWYRMTALERDVIEIPQAWLTRVAGRICLDVLQSARSRREHYVGEWLPEPLPAATFGAARVGATDPLDRVSLDESVSTALLLVLESMTPAERVAFVLHDVFALPFDEIAEIVGRSPAATRQLATSARRRISGDRAREATRSEHDDVVRAFAIACQTGDMAALIAVLDPRVAVRSDGGGRVSAARRPVHGADAVARFLFGILTKRPGMRVSEQQTGDGLAFAMWEEGRIVGVVNLGVLHGVVSEVWIMLNPDKLTMWSELSDPFFGASPTS